MDINIKPFQDMLWMVTQGLLVIAIPIVVRAGLSWAKEQMELIRQQLSDSQRKQIDDAISIAVRTAEQLGISGELVGSGEKKKRAIAMAQDYLNQHGVSIDIGTLADLVEAEVLRQNDNGFTWNKEQKIKEAVGMAVQAYKDSGSSTEVLRLSKNFVDQYLSKAGISLDTNVLDGLINSELAKLASATGNVQ